MSQKEELTIECYDKFDSQFDLVNHAIRLAVNLIDTGREPRVKLSSQNPAVIVLKEIKEHKDFFNNVEMNSEGTAEKKNYGSFRTENVEG